MKFSIDEFKRRSTRLDTEDLDFEAFRDEPLDADVLRCIAYMHDVEHHTVCYLRDVLVTDAHRDHEVTSFLSCWAYEEFWHGEALGRVLEAHGQAGSDARVPATRLRAGRHDKMMPIYTMVANKLSPHVPAAHMTWGAINEWTAQAAYGRLAVRSGHPVLSELLARIKKQEGRHIDFYASQATERLAASSSAQRLTRFALARFWSPVGAGVMPDEEVAHLSSYLFADAAGRKAIARIDRRIDRLPGLEGLGLLAREEARRLGRPVAEAAGGTGRSAGSVSSRASGRLRTAA